MSTVPPGPPPVPSATDLVENLASGAQMIAVYLGILSRSTPDGDLPELVCGLRDLASEARSIHGELLRRWVDPGPPGWAPSSMGAVPAVVQLAERVVFAAAAAVQSLPDSAGFEAAINERRADCSVAVGRVLAGYDEDRVRADVLRSAMRMNGGKAVPVLDWSDGGRLKAQIEAYEALPEGYATAPPGTLAAGAEEGEGETPAPSVKTGSGGTRQRASVNARMLETIQINHEARGWTCTQWARYLKCGRTSVVDTPTWKELGLVRKRQRAERANDRRRRLRK